MLPLSSPSILYMYLLLDSWTYFFFVSFRTCFNFIQESFEILQLSSFFFFWLPMTHQKPTFYCLLLVLPSCQIQPSPGWVVRGHSGGPALLCGPVFPGRQPGSHLQHHAGSVGTTAQAARHRQGRDQRCWFTKGKIRETEVEQIPAGGSCLCFIT